MIYKVQNRLLQWPALRKMVRAMGKAQVECRAATPGDAPEVARLMEPLFPATARTEALPSAERLLSETARSGGEYRVAHQGKEILAGCQVGPLMRNVGFEGCWVLGLWVHPSTRGRGIGETLIQDVIEVSRQRGEKRLYCHIASTNAASLSLFQKLGFAPAPPDLQKRIEEKFGSAFDKGCEIYSFVLDL